MAKRAKIYNKGSRNWTFKDNKKDVNLEVGKSVELDKIQVDKLVKAYPHEFIHGEGMAVSGNDSKKLTAKIEKLEKENSELKTYIKELEDTEPETPEPNKD